MDEKDLKQKANDALDDLKGAASKAVIKSSLEKIGKESDATSTFDKLKYVILIGGFGVLFMFLVLWLMGLMKWLFGAAVIAVLGGGAWFLLKPKLIAFREKIEAKRLAKKVERERLENEAREEERKLQKAKAIDDELASLKEKASAE